MLIIGKPKEYHQRTDQKKLPSSEPNRVIGTIDIVDTDAIVSYKIKRILYPEDIKYQVWINTIGKECYMCVVNEEKEAVSLIEIIHGFCEGECIAAVTPKHIDFFIELMKELQKKENTNASPK